MPRIPARFAPQVAPLESRLVLSAVLTPSAYEAARARITQVVVRLDATGDVDRAEAALGRAVRSIPDGAALLPTLDTALAMPGVSPRAVMADVNTLLRAEVAAGTLTVPSAALRRTIGLVAAVPPSASVPVIVVTPPPSTGPIAPAPTPSSLSVSIHNAVTSNLAVGFSQVVNGIRTQLTGVAVQAGATARFVPIITQNSTPIIVSAQSPAVGYWEITAPPSFSQLEIQYIYGRCYFYFKA